METYRYRIAAVDRAFDILEALERRSDLRLSDIAREVELTESTTLRYLNSLRARGLVEREEDNAYRLGLRLFQLGERAVDDRDLRRSALPHLTGLRDQFDETVNLAARHRDDVIIVEVVESQRSIRKGASLAETDQWHCSGLGKALLAAMPVEEAQAILARRGTPRTTARTLTSVDAVLEDLSVTAARGYALDNEEAEIGLTCVAAPVLDRRGHPAYSISVSGPTERMSKHGLSTVGKAVMAAADRVSEAFGFQPGVAARSSRAT